MTTPLLQTKLYLPPAGPNLVSRPRLVERLDEGLHTTKLTLISAPAGYGKTTLLSEWFAAGDRPVAWISLDKGDNDLVSFLTYLVAALRTINAGVGDDVLSVLQSPQVPVLELLLTLLINEIAVQLGSTAFFQASSGQEMTISVLEGSAEVEALGEAQIRHHGRGHGRGDPL